MPEDEMKDEIRRQTTIKHWKYFRLKEHRGHTHKQTTTKIVQTQC